MPTLRSFCQNRLLKLPLDAGGRSNPGCAEQMVRAAACAAVTCLQQRQSRRCLQWPLSKALLPRGQVRPLTRGVWRGQAGAGAGAELCCARERLYCLQGWSKHGDSRALPAEPATALHQG